MPFNRYVGQFRMRLDGHPARGAHDLVRNVPNPLIHSLKQHPRCRIKWDVQLAADIRRRDPLLALLEQSRKRFVQAINYGRVFRSL